MNHRLCEPLAWDDSRTYDRGKVMTEAELEAGKDFGRYLDVDGDGIPYRTLPGTHPSRGAYFTRGTTRDAYARYSEAGPDYLYNVTRLLEKFETAKELVPQPILRKAARETRFGVIYFGSTSPAMSEEELEARKDFGRYLDVDGDGIPYRTLPGTHASRGAYFTRGTTRDAYARYSEAGPDYLYNVTRLLEKFETAKELVPQPILRKAARETRFGVIYFGSTSPAMAEAFDALQADGVHVDTLRVRAFPFSAAVDRFIAEHETVFVVEQNRDAQLRMMLVNEQEIDPARLEPILHYDGTPITARFIIEAIAARVRADNVEPIAKVAKKGLAA
jgi:pyruvate/2-oxoacid:ferredoxin oxidoreductase alpha subunit